MIRVESCEERPIIISQAKMDSISNEITFEFFGIRMYKDGRVERNNVGFAPPSLDDPSTGVSSKDVVIDPQTGVCARLFLPKVSDPNKKLPLLIYTHGGAFCMESAFSPLYHIYLNSLVAEANVVALSVEYRLAPENPVSILYDDVWRSLQWAISHSEKEEWLKKHADFNRVFLAGDSAGGNITHNVAMRAGNTELKGVNIAGAVLFHPLFCGADPIGSEVTNKNHIRAGKLWCDVCPGTIGSDDPRFNPVKDSNLSKIGCKRMFVCVAQEDELRDRGKLYYEELGKCGWDGVVEFMEAEGENHVFHLFKPNCEKAKELMKRVVSFLNSSD